MIERRGKWSYPEEKPSYPEVEPCSTTGTVQRGAPLLCGQHYGHGLDVRLLGDGGHGRHCYHGDGCHPHACLVSGDDGSHVTWCGCR